MRHTEDPEIDEQVRAFGENMRAARHDAGLSQVELSEATRLDRAAISFLERAERAPDLSTLVRVARALDRTPAALLKGVGLAPTRGAGRGGRSEVAGQSAEPGTRFGANLRAARTGAGLSQEVLAYEAVVDRAAISVYERGRREPNLRTILKLARALGLSPVTLLAGVK
ncbi:MAG TPA: helix-turn-helix transcriptional regulator [Solirubrobacteraceae bacterium]|jgi:transcriptional regulator with XRE-family HTH domain|nr:helix-turn-helix transcriptional regulator [Solirubrobacteraceae bacterium]